MIKIKEIFTSKIVISLLYAIVTVIYFIIFSLQYSKLGVSLERYIDISSLILLLTSISIMEIAYKRNNQNIFINGIEILVIAVFVLLTQYITKLSNYSIQVYTLAGADTIAIYYILKSIIIYTKEQQDELNKLSDIKEIVKDIPIKKVSKRKNKKIEEGK